MSRTHAKTFNCEECQDPDDANMIKCEQCSQLIHFVCLNSDVERENINWKCKSCCKRGRIQRSIFRSPFKSSCELCDARDDMEMVQCDQCDKWYHYSCVNVTDDIKNVYWSCDACVKDGDDEIETEFNDGDNNKTLDTVNTSKSLDPKLDTVDLSHTPSIEENDEEPLKLRKVNSDNISDSDLQGAVGGKVLEQPNKLNANNVDLRDRRSENASTKTSSSIREQRLKVLEEQEALLNKEEEFLQRRRDHLAQKQQLIEEMSCASNRSSRSSEKMGSTARIEKWLNDLKSLSMIDPATLEANIGENVQLPNRRNESNQNQFQLIPFENRDTGKPRQKCSQTRFEKKVKILEDIQVENVAMSVVNEVHKLQKAALNTASILLSSNCSKVNASPSLGDKNGERKILEDLKKLEIGHDSQVIDINEDMRMQTRRSPRETGTKPKEKSTTDQIQHSSNAQPVRNIKMNNSHLFSKSNADEPTTQSVEPVSENQDTDVKNDEPTTQSVEPVSENQDTDVKNDESTTQFVESAKKIQQSSNNELNSHHLAARYATPKELPVFNGKPEEWPLFINSFEQSTQVCGFSNVENLLRLQKALKNKAYESVKSMLLLPDMVPNVILTLRRLFGRPEIIIHTLLEKIRSEPALKPDKLETLISFALSVQNLCCTIEACKLTEHLNNPVLLQELSDKLPTQERLRWARKKAELDSINIKSFSTWLENEAEIASSVTLMCESSQATLSKGKGFMNLHTTESEQSTEQVEERSCRVCKGHCLSVENCTKFLEMVYKARWTAVKDNYLCRKCLRSHTRSRCKSTKVCGMNNCTFKHHKLLHNFTKDGTLNENTISKQDGKTDEPQNCQFHQTHSTHSILFKIVPVKVYANEHSVSTFAFLDDGSSLTLMEDSLMTELGLTGTPKPLCLKWTSNTHRIEEASQMLSFEIGNSESNKRYHVTNAHSVKTLDLPVQNMPVEELSRRYPYLKGTPVKTYENAKPRLLIGIDNARLMMPSKSREGNDNGPVVSKTRLGWAIYGLCELSMKQNLKPRTTFHNFHICECSKERDCELESMVKDYFATENNGIQKLMKNLDNPEDVRANMIMHSTTKRQNDRYCTGLLWKYDNASLPNSLPMARRRLNCLIKKMERDPILKENLNKQIKYYVEKGYARKLSLSEAEVKQPREWYLPVFPVVNPSKPNKIRLVWDAAAKVDGISLNSLLLKGSDMLSLLPAVLYRFRERRVAICADIQEMYHQVMVQTADQSSQRFLWPNSDPSKDPDKYVMQVMTFGATCSPSCAQFIKNKNAELYAAKFPRAFTAITQNHYVDDMLDSLDTETEAVELANQVKMIHANGGFNIRNWRSNSTTVLECLGETVVDCKSMNVGCQLQIEKILGMWWNAQSDEFTYSLIYNKASKGVLSGNIRPTKRELLRTVSSIFDPLGLLANFLVHAKILLQEVWRTGIEWDDCIKDQQYEKWLNWIKILPNVENIRISRWYRGGNSAELHIFVDASEDAYGAVAYLRFTKDDEVSCALVGAKSRVAPIKMQSIPRLELEACLLGARLSRVICEGHSIEISKRWFWSDSKTALSWIKSDHRRYRQFVAFRVSELLDLSNIPEWRWIPSKMNVADELTKWGNIFNFSSNSRWFIGPEFLYLNESEWPTFDKQNLETREEMKSHCLHISTITLPLIDIQRFSSWNRILRVTAYVIRFANNILQTGSRANQKRKGVLQQEEYMAAENLLFQQAQAESFPSERAVLIDNLSLSSTEQISLKKNSPLAKLSPIIDEKGVLRIRGRTVEADIHEHSKQPIIMPKNNQITLLLIQHYHAKFCHINHETVINELRQLFYIPQLRVMMKKVRRNCQLCKNLSVSPAPPEMGNLPKARVSSFCRPFTYLGIDYFGPLYVRVNRRTEKRWGVLFTCLSIRAVHLEVAHSLTTDSCIMCLENFINRRGQPAEIFSDNGTNFKGAANELELMKKALDQNRLAERFTSSSTKWNFIPPASPHMGGSWERLVRSVKSVLEKLSPKHQPTDEELLNMFTSIENIVNSRPLTYIPLEHENDEALTPNHFLLGSSNGNKPKGPFIDDGVLWRKNWMKVQQFADIFWRRWVREYLPTLTRRTKWFAPVKPLAKGDVVVIVDELSPRNCWPKGIVLDVVLGKSGQARKATVQTKTGIYVRPAIKIAVLDVYKEAEESKLIQSISLPGENVGNRDADVEII